MKELIRQIESIGDSVNFEEEIAKYSWDRKPEVAGWLRGDKYYRMMAAYCKLHRPTSVVEVGTMYGNSALALAKYSGMLTCYDIDMSNLVTRDILSGNIRAIELPNGNDCIEIPYGNFDLIYLDIGDHSGYYESMIHNRLQKCYKGYVFYDDIYWGKMKPFWESISNEKMELDWHGDSGFGIVKYV